MEALGIEPTLLIAQIVNFFVIVAVLNVLLYKPILKTLEKRKKEIAEGLAYTEKMRVEQEKADAKKESFLAEARIEGQRIIDEARKTAKAEEKEIITQAHAAAEDMIAKAKTTVSQEREAMQKDMKRESVQLAIAMAKRLLSGSVTTDLQHQILAKQIQEIEKV